MQRHLSLCRHFFRPVSSYHISYIMCVCVRACVREQIEFSMRFNAMCCFIALNYYCCLFFFLSLSLFLSLLIFVSAVFLFVSCIRLNVKCKQISRAYELRKWTDNDKNKKKIIMNRLNEYWNKRDDKSGNTHTHNTQMVYAKISSINYKTAAK